MTSEIETTTPEQRGRRLRIAILAAVVPYLLLVWRFDFVCDDAYISFRYAQHLAEGVGLRFNPGTHQPVEGYSNLLWVLFLTPFEALGLDVTLAARAGGTAAGLALIALVTRFAIRSFGLGTLGAVATALLLATLPPLVVWSSGGLETVPFTLLLFYVFERLLSDPAKPHTGQAALFAALAELTRTDGAVWIGIVLAAVLCVALFASPDRARRTALLRAVAVVAGALALTVCCHTGWRFWYHGDIISNTARAKGILQPVRGLTYVASFFLAVPSAALAILAGIWAQGRHARRHANGVALATGIVTALGLVYVALPGGDFMTMGRLLVPLAPMTALLLAGALQAGIARGGFGARALWAVAAASIALSVATAFDVHAVPRTVRERLSFRDNTGLYQTEVEMWRSMRDRARFWSLQGRALGLYTEPGESMIAYAIGAIGYHSDLFLYDAFGLVDRDVARIPPTTGLSQGHARLVTPEFFYPRKPTYYGAAIVDRRASFGAGLGVEDFANSALSTQVRIERHALPRNQAFPPGLELRVFRFTLWPLEPANDQPSPR
jgi:hypothetical protein